MKRSLFFLLFLFSTSVFAQKKLLILGDSLSDGYGVAREDSYPSLLEKKIKNSGKNWTINNASISGSTTASAVSRLKWQLKNKPDMLILALGANDGLRGFPTEEIYKNLSEAIKLAKKENITVVLAGMQMPPNYNKQYATQYANIFKKVAVQQKIKLIPFLLDKVAGESKLNQADGIHPNEAGHKIMADTVFATIQDLL